MFFVKTYAALRATILRSMCCVLLCGCIVFETGIAFAEQPPQQEMPDIASLLNELPAESIPFLVYAFQHVEQWADANELGSVLRMNGGYAPAHPKGKAIKYMRANAPKIMMELDAVIENLNNISLAFVRLGEHCALKLTDTHQFSKPTNVKMLLESHVVQSHINAFVTCWKGTKALRLQSFPRDKCPLTRIWWQKAERFVEGLLGRIYSGLLCDGDILPWNCVPEGEAMSEGEVKKYVDQTYKQFAELHTMYIQSDACKAQAKKIVRAWGALMKDDLFFEKIEQHLGTLDNFVINLSVGLTPAHEKLIEACVEFRNGYDAMVINMYKMTMLFAPPHAR